MSYQADLLNAYRDQLARIKAAFEALEFEECYAVHGLEELEAAINGSEVYELEHMYDAKEPPIILPDGPSHMPDDQEWASSGAITKPSRETVIGVKGDGSTYTIEIGSDDDEDTQA